LQVALMSIQPIITVYIAQMATHSSHIALLSGLVFSASGFASLFAAPRLGRLADRIGPPKIILAALLAAGILFIPQAFVRNAWELMGLRFLLGIATAGLLPSINTLLTKVTPGSVIGRIFGYNQSAQFLGSFFGALMGGQIAAFWGVRYVFLTTGLLLLINAVWVYGTVLKGRYSRRGR
jgi:Arabinose efflux permease